MQYVTIAVLMVIMAAGYRISLWLHPFHRCWRCKGTGKHFGAIYRTALRPCRACQGNGRKPRLGSRSRTEE